MKILLILTIFLCSCTPYQVNNVQATAGRDESTKVDQVSIPYQDSYSKYVLIVEPIKNSDSVIRTVNDETSQVSISDKLTAQLQSALIKVGNFELVDSASVKKLKMKKGEVGPFIVRSTITEFNEMSEAEAKERGGSLGMVGAVMGVAGAVSGKPGLTWTGAGIAAANPGYSDGVISRVGQVAFDTVIVDSRTGRIINSFDSSGLFKASSAQSGFSLFGFGTNKAEFKQSALGQALRAALNDTVEQTWSSIKGRR